MAQIVKRNASELIRPGSMPQPQMSTALARSVEGFGGAISSAGRTLEAVREHAQKRAEEKENFVAANEKQKFQFTVAEDLAKATETIAPDGAGFTDKFSETFDTRAAEYLAKLPPRIREKEAILLDRKTGSEAAQWTIKSAEVERNQSYSWVDTQLAESAEASAAVIAENPDNYEAELAKHIDLTLKSPVPTKRKMERIADYERLARDAWITGMTAKDPEGLLLEIKADPRNLSEPTQYNLLERLVIGVESSGDTNAVSPKGAAGLMQVMPRTAVEISEQLGDGLIDKGMSDERIRGILSDPAIGVRYGRYYLQKQIKAFGKTGGLEAALIAYNGGPGRAKAWIASGGDDSVIPEETRDYYTKIMAQLPGMKRSGGGSVAASADPSTVQLVFDEGSMAEARKYGSKVGEAGVPPELVERVKLSFASLGLKEVKVNSGHRNETHNKAAEGNPNSQHVKENAMDIDVSGYTHAERNQLIQTLSANGVGGIGVGKNIIHVDLGKRRAWGYANPAGGGKVPPWAQEAVNAHLANKATVAGTSGRLKGLTFEERERAIKGAITAIETRENETQLAARVSLDAAVTNAPIAVFSTGVYDGEMPDIEDFMDAYGVDEGEERHKAFKASVDTSKEAYGMRSASKAEIDATVAAAAPTSSGNDAAAQAARYETLSAARKATLDARDADPAGYVRKLYPNINKAFDNIKTDEDYRTAVAMSVAAQEKLGIVDIKPLQKEAAQVTVDRFKDANLPEPERFERVVSTLLLTPDVEQRRAIFEQLVEAGLPEHTEGAFEALARGDTAAGTRLLRAATLDFSEQSGKTPEKPAVIAQAWQDEVMAPGKIGDIFYGLSEGGMAQNYVRSQRDAKLVTAALNVRLRGGENLEDAVKGVAKDLYGDVQVVEGDSRVNLQIYIPAKDDPDEITDGLARALPDVRAAMIAYPRPQGETRDSSAAIFEAAPKVYAELVINEGFFRNYGDGYVFIDTYGDEPVFGKDGKPIIFYPKEAPLRRDPSGPADPDAPLTDDSFDAFQKRFGQ